MIAYMMKDMITTSVLRFIHFTQEMFPRVKMTDFNEGYLIENMGNRIFI